MAWKMDIRRTIIRKRCGNIIAGTIFLICLTLFYIDNDRSLLPISHRGYISDSEEPYIHRFDTRTFGQNDVKVILIWSKCFNSYHWEEVIRESLKRNCRFKCVVTSNRTMLDRSDALLFHFTDKDLLKSDLPSRRYPHQVLALYINEPNTYIQESFTPWKNFFNWTISYRRHSTVFTPYGFHIPRKDSNFKVDMLPPSRRNKMAYAVISRCADAAKRYKLVDEISKFIDVDVYGRCGTLKCEVRDNICLTNETLSNYKFRLAFEDSNCRDYVTEKYWTTIEKNIIPVVDWKEHQNSPIVPPNSFINVNNFKDIKYLTDYLLQVSRDDALFLSYFEWRKNFTIFTSSWDSICNVCAALYDRKIPAQVYTDLEGWLRDDACPRFTVNMYIYQQY